MNETDDIDQFQVLEEKVDSLIQLISDLRKEKELLADKVQHQEREISEITKQVEDLKLNRNSARQRVLALLGKIRQINV